LRRSGEKCPVGRSKAEALGLAPKDTQLMTEHDDLEILGGLALAISDSSLSIVRISRYASDKSIVLPCFFSLIDEDYES
jgi:hypothetical protein